MDIFAFLNQFAAWILGFTLPFLVGIGVTYLMGKWGEWKLGKYAKQLEIIGNIVEYAVTAAEQLGLTKVINDKKAYALKLAEVALATRGVNIPLAEIVARIEAEVLRQFPHFPEFDLPK